MNEDTKQAVLNQIAAGRQWRKASGRGRSKWFIGDSLIHMRFCSNANYDGTTYAYNINPNTLDSHFEVWICGSPSIYYLIPISVIRTIYDHPNAYVDSWHPEMRVAHINTASHQSAYSRNGHTLDFKPFRNATLQATNGA